MISENYARKLIRSGSAKVVGPKMVDGFWHTVIDKRDKRGVHSFDVFRPKNATR